MTTLDLVKAMQIGNIPLERIAAAIGVKTALVDYACWVAIDGSELSKLRATRMLETARADWRE